MAALANGTQAHALDYDDVGTLPVPFHPSVPVLPVALALGEAASASGKDVLLAYIIGVEVETKVAAAIKKSHFARGWHPTATVGVLGATAAAAKLLRLDAEQVTTTLGIASSLAGGLRQNFGTMTKPLHAGNAARNGIMAALLAQRGFTAAPAILEAPVGFFTVLVGKGEYSAEGLAASLGNPFTFDRPGVVMKKYPSCRGTHASIEALEELLKVRHVSPGEVERIECAVPCLDEGPNHLSNPRPRTSLEGKFSLEHCLSALLVDGEVGLRQFSQETVLNPAIEKTRNKVRVLPLNDRPGQTRAEEDLRARVTMQLRDGTRLSRVRQIARGTEAPWPWEDVIRKFRQCARLALPPGTVSELAGRLRRLDELKKASEIVDLALGDSNHR